MIHVHDLRKTFRVAKRNPGLRQAVKALFSREYETIRALDGLGFDIADGEIVGYIGPNGAGKSTTIKILCGVLTPDGGECLVDGRVPWKERVEHARGIGVVFGQRSQLWWDVPAIDSFELLRDIYRVDGAGYRAALDELTELLDLSELLRTPLRSLSLGQRMRCELAASLLHSPKTLFLDEPTIGLDAVSKIAVRQFIKKINRERGTTVVLTTHDMQDIEALSDRILVIGRGRILLDGTLQDLHGRAGARKKLVVEYDPAAPAPTPPEGAELLEAREGRMELTVDTRRISAAAAVNLVSAQTDALDISVTPVSAEELVAEMYKEYRI